MAGVLCCALDTLIQLTRYSLLQVLRAGRKERLAPVQIPKTGEKVPVCSFTRGVISTAASIYYAPDLFLQNCATHTDSTPNAVCYSGVSSACTHVRIGHCNMIKVPVGFKHVKITMKTTLPSSLPSAALLTLPTPIRSGLAAGHVSHFRTGHAQYGRPASVRLPSGTPVTVTKTKHNMPAVQSTAAKPKPLVLGTYS